jgi:hypothetical protein
MITHTLAAETKSMHVPWNKGKLTGQTRPLLPKGVVTLTATTRAFSRPISWFMEQQSRPAIAP